jgi:hypothetical protein
LLDASLAIVLQQLAENLGAIVEAEKNARWCRKSVEVRCFDLEPSHGNLLYFETNTRCIHTFLS